MTKPKITAPERYTILGTRCAVDPKANYGFWERADGSEGGGLWFQDKELTDYDGAFELPKVVAEELRAMGFVVGPDFDAE